MNWQLSPQAAAQELLTRRQARRRLIDFTRYTYPSYIADPVHNLIAAYLDRVVAGEITRLMIFAPPQHGKSEQASVRLPAYWLARRPDDPVIIASYGADLAVSKSRQARDVVEGGEYRALFGDLGPQSSTPVVTRGDSRAVNEWRLAPPHRGSIRAVGVGGGLTGYPGRLGVIDDPIANWREAQSEAIREATWEWYKSVFRPRIWEKGAIVPIMTRWHEDDLAGKLLQQQASEWTVLRLPAVAETQEERDANNRYLGLPTGQADLLGRKPGEPLAPSRFSQAALLALQRDVGSLVWAAEYTGVPRPAEGSRFKRA